MNHFFITGATGDIGNVIAAHLAQKHNLTLSARNLERLEPLVSNLGTSKTNIDTVLVDYTDKETLYNCRCFLKEKDTLLDGAVIMTPRPNLKESLFPNPVDWLELFNSSFIGPLELIHCLIPHFKPKAKVVIISGIASVQYMPGKVPFSVLRSMWLAQAKALAYELGPKGISVNTISPGGVMTKKVINKMQKRADEQQQTFNKTYEQSVSNVPLGKYATPEEIAAIVEFFLSLESNHITGANLVCDGGFNRCY